MKSLIQRQDACIARMLEPRTSERRAAKEAAAAAIEDAPADDAAPKRRRRKADPDGEGDTTPAAS